MTKAAVSRTRRLFARNFFHGLRVVWPIFSGILVALIGMSLCVGWLEGWNAGDSIYFGFVTALTIGYGDFVPTTLGARILSILLGMLGFIFTGILAAVAVHALRDTITLPDAKAPEDPL